MAKVEGSNPFIRFIRFLYVGSPIRSSDGSGGPAT
jgi:hypothetical protein